MPLSTSDNVDHPISLYAATKKSNELMAHTYSHLFGLPREIRSTISRGESRKKRSKFHWGLPTTGLRFFTVYGPCLSREMRSKFHREGRPDMALFLFTKAIMKDQPIKVFNNGNMVRDFTYIDDIVEGVLRVIDNPPTISDKKEIDASISKTAPYKVYNIGNSSPVQLMEYISAIEKKLNKEAVKEYLPMQPGDVPKTEASVTDLMEDLGYKPSTPIEKGIESFIDWYKSYFGIK